MIIITCSLLSFSVFAADTTIYDELARIKAQSNTKLNTCYLLGRFIGKYDGLIYALSKMEKSPERNQKKNEFEQFLHSSAVKNIEAECDLVKAN